MNAAVEQKVELVLKKVKGEAGRKFREMNENQRMRNSINLSIVDGNIASCATF